MTRDDAAPEGEAPEAEEPEEVEDLGRAPLLKRERFYCPRCGAFAHQTWWKLRVGRNNTLRDAVDSHGVFVPTGSSGGVLATVGQWSMSTCESCGESAVWRDDRIMFPTSSMAPLPHPDMPPAARELYLEAGEVVGVSRRAGAALARAALERVLFELDPMTGRPDLSQRIEHVLGSVSEPLAQMLTVVRYAGNKSLHPDPEPGEMMVLLLNPEEVEIVEVMFTSINELVQELVTAPARTKSIFGKLPAAIQEAFLKSQERAASKGQEEA